MATAILGNAVIFRWELVIRSDGAILEKVGSKVVNDRQWVRAQNCVLVKCLVVATFLRHHM